MKKIVLFLHGYGSNGNDLISLKDYILLNKETTEFISPNAPEPCEFNYFGYQWFPLKERSIEELKIGLKSAFSHLDSIIEKIILEHSVDASHRLSRLENRPAAYSTSASFDALLRMSAICSARKGSQMSSSVVMLWQFDAKGLL